MTKQLDTETVKVRVANEGFTLLSQYSGYTKHIQLKCPKGHVCQTTLSVWTNNTKCVKCAESIKIAKHKEDVRLMVEGLGFTLISCGDIKKEGFTAKCPKGHVKKYNYFSFKKGHHCGICAGRVADIDKISQAFINKGYTQLSDYIGALNPIKFRCDAGHIHQMTATQIMRGDDCGVCYGRYLTTEQVKHQIESENYELLSDYVDAYAPLTYRCPVGHVHTVTWRGWQSGNRCRECCNRGFDHNKPGTLYYLRFDYNGTYYYKIGITNKTVEERYGRENTPYKILKTVFYSDGRECYNDEQSILKRHSPFLYKKEPILRDGNSELFIKDVLDLDI